MKKLLLAAVLLAGPAQAQILDYSGSYNAGGTAGVTTFNTRTGTVTLQLGDVAAVILNQNITTGTGSISGTGFNNAGHFVSTGAAPTVSSCGTSPSISGTDSKGLVTIGTGSSVTACTITFATAYATAPACTISDDQSNIRGDILYPILAGSLTVQFQANMAGNHWWYICVQ